MAPQTALSTTASGYNFTLQPRVARIRVVGLAERH
jgi:hypothetical protein